MDYDLVDEMHVNELKNYLKVYGLKISGNKNELVARVFFLLWRKVYVSENCCWSRGKFKERIWKETERTW